MRTASSLLCTVLATVAAAQSSPPKLDFVEERPELGKPLVSYNFDRENRGRPAFAFDGFGDWRVVDGTVDLIFGRDASVGGYVDLGGSTKNPGRFETKHTIVFVPGVTYSVRFDYFSPTGDPRGAEVKIGDKSFRVQTARKTAQRFTATFEFSESAQERVVFRDLGRNNAGLAIDNIEIVPVRDGRN